MKRIFSLALVACFILTSCSSDEAGPRGPEGPQGPPGDDGLIGAVFEIEGDFTAENDYTLFTTYSDFTDVEVFESDVVQVYLLSAQDSEVEGDPIDVWRALPQMYYEENGTVTYNYDFTFFDVNIFLDSNLELGSLSSDYTDNQVFRVAIIPAEFAQNQNLDINNYKEVMSTMKIQEKDIPVLELQ